MSVPEPSAVPPKRQRYQFSLRTLLLLPLVLALVLSAVYSWPYLHRRYIVWRLQEYVDKDLSDLPAAQQIRVYKWLVTLVGTNGGSARMLHNADVPGVGRRLLVVRSTEIEFSFRPGSACTCHLDALDSWGRATKLVEFHVGLDLISLAFDEPRHGFLCLKVDAQQYDPFDEGADRKPYRVAHQLFFIADGHAELVHDDTFDKRQRTELSREPLPECPGWQDCLESDDRVQQIRGLAAYWYNFEKHPQKSIDEKLRRRLAELSTSPDPWISEEAKLALEEAMWK
jgi:hypothetical protein